MDTENSPLTFEKFWSWFNTTFANRLVENGNMHVGAIDGTAAGIATDGAGGVGVGVRL